MSRIEDLIQELCPAGVEYAKIGALAQVGTGRSDRKDAIDDGDYPFYVRSKDVMRIDSYEFDDEALLIPGEGGIGEIFHYVNGKYALHQRAYRIHFTDARVNPRFAYFYFSAKFKRFILQKAVSATVTSIRKPMILDFPFPVPPLEVQREIVGVLDKFTQLEAELEAELEARRAQYEHYRTEFLTFGEEVPRRRLDEVAAYANGKAHEKLVVDGAEIPLVTARFISRNGEANRYVPLEDVLTPGRTGDVALVLSDLPKGRALARTFFVDRDASYAINQRVARITVKDLAEMNPKFLHFVLDRNRGLLKHDNGVDQTHLSKGQVTGLMIPVPSIDEQNQIVDDLEDFDALVNDISIGLPAELAARRKQYEHYRDRLLSFKELTA